MHGSPWIRAYKLKTDGRASGRLSFYANLSQSGIDTCNLFARLAVHFADQRFLLLPCEPLDLHLPPHGLFFIRLAGEPRQLHWQVAVCKPSSASFAVRQHSFFQVIRPASVEDTASASKHIRIILL